MFCIAVSFTDFVENCFKTDKESSSGFLGLSLAEQLPFKAKKKTIQEVSAGFWRRKPGKSFLQYWALNSQIRTDEEN
jgi:hypothetical protein